MNRLKLGGVAGRHYIPNINGYVLDMVSKTYLPQIVR